MPELILQPSFDDKTRAEIEAHLEQVRARRMVAALAYQEAKRLKMDHEAEQMKRRLEAKVARLEKGLETLDKALARVESYVVDIETLYQEIGLTEAMLDLQTGDDK
jgi:flagellar basal body-associated protein FliL